MYPFELYRFLQKDTPVDDEDVFTIEPLDLRTEYSFPRKIQTGEIDFQNFKENVLVDGNWNPKTSFSIKRDVASLQEGVRGNASFTPFMPGGLEPSDLITTKEIVLETGMFYSLDNNYFIKILKKRT